MSLYTTGELLTDTINEMDSNDLDPKRQLELDIIYQTLTAVHGETTTKHLFVNFSEYTKDGLNYMLWDSSDSFEDYTYLGLLVLPTIPKKDLMDKAANKLDEEITTLERKIFNIKEKKQQLLALENHSEETE